MKSYKQFIAITALAAISLSYGNLASAADLTAWRTAAVGSLVGTSFSADQSFIGRATNPAICGTNVTSCNIVVRLDKSTTDTVTKLGTFSGDIIVVGPDPLGLPILPDNTITSYKVSGSLNINTFSASGIFSQGSAKRAFTAVFRGAPLVILDAVDHVTPVFGGGVLEVDLTLAP